MPHLSAIPAPSKSAYQRPYKSRRQRRETDRRKYDETKDRTFLLRLAYAAGALLLLALAFALVGMANSTAAGTAL